MMAFATAKSSYCTYTAAAYTSAPVRRIMDTAPLAVSIVIARQICVQGT